MKKNFGLILLLVSLLSVSNIQASRADGVDIGYMLGRNLTSAAKTFYGNNDPCVDRALELAGAALCAQDPDKISCSKEHIANLKRRLQSLHNYYFHARCNKKHGAKDICSKLDLAISKVQKELRDCGVTD